MESIDDLQKEFVAYLACDALLGTKSDYAQLLSRFPGKILNVYIDGPADIQEISMGLIYHLIMRHKYPEQLPSPGIPKEVLDHEPEEFKKMAAFHDPGELTVYKEECIGGLNVVDFNKPALRADRAGKTTH